MRRFVPSPIRIEAGRICTVDLTVEDALGVGYSLSALMKQNKLPPGTAAVYERVAAQMVAAAKLAVTDGNR